jgi:hypothetical protein
VAQLYPRALGFPRNMVYVLTYELNVFETGIQFMSWQMNEYGASLNRLRVYPKIPYQLVKVKSKVRNQDQLESFFGNFVDTCCAL